MPADSDSVDLCNEGRTAPAPDEYTLDFSLGYMSSLWNELIIEKFTAATQAAHRDSPDNWGVPEVTDEYVAGEFYNQLKQSQESWAKRKPRFVMETQEMETEEEVVARVNAAESKRRATAASNQAKRRVSLYIMGVTVT